MKKVYCVIVLSLFQIVISANEKGNITKDLSDLLDEYFRALSQEGTLDFTIILSSNQFYEDGSLLQADTLAFASKSGDDTILKNFNLSSINKKSIKKLVSDAKRNGILLSLYQETQDDNVKNAEDFDTTQPDEIEAAAANVVLHPDGFVVGLEEEIRNAMDLTENVATIQVLEYFEEGPIKRNTTTTVYSNKINVLDSYKMPPRMIQTSAELLKKAYRIDMDDRSPFIARLFEKEYPRYVWTVIVNSKTQITKKSVSVTLATGQDKYDIIGIFKK